VQALNQVVDRVTLRNGLLPGPDLYAWFKAHPDELGPDGVHPTDTGTRSINRLWYEALRSLYSAKP
jgi:acyl-CoA thioesterase I